MASINVSGLVGTDPEIKFFDGKNGSFGVARFRLAYTPREKDKATGDWVDGETTWFTVSVVGKQAETIADSLSKGQRVLVNGTFKQNTYTTKSGETKTDFEIKADKITLEISFKPKKTEMNNSSAEWSGGWN